ncbi:MAG: class I SAM-dependent methyltransferase [Chloroflexota bacterium]|nr:MAG: class I SAM-dependent methyltransferase [Chloroflexota bacterium]
MEDLPFWLSLAQQTGGPILELGCGTGRILASLARAGYPVVGLDIDADMLAYLKANLPAGLEPAPHVFLADMASFCLGREFPLIIMPCNTLSSLPAAVRQAALACLRLHLQPGGVFAASLPNPVVLASMPRLGEPEVEDDFPHPITGNPVQVSSAWKRTRREFILDWQYDHLLTDGNIERLTARTRHLLDPVSIHRAGLSQAGLELIQEYGDYDRSPYQANSPYWIFACRPA